MRALEKNKQKMYYSLQTAELPVYETDDEGNIIYIEVDGEKIPVETGEHELGYTVPTEFFGNIALNSGDSTLVAYGIDTSSYDAILVTEKNYIPIDETSLIWFQSSVGYKDADQTIVDKNTADYRVLSVQPSLNEVQYLLGKLTK